MTVTIPEPDGCPWPVDPACLGDEWDANFDEPTQTRAVALASKTLRRLTAYRVGGCAVKIRPCSTVCNSFISTAITGQFPGFVPLNWNGAWTNCACPGPCGHGDPAKALKIPPPVYGVDTVHLNGTLLVEGTDWRYEKGWLYALGSTKWPLTQDLSQPSTAAGTFEVAYFDSARPDGLAAYAAGKLAFQYANACAGKKCDLPATVTAVVRQGVSYTLAAGSFPNGETGIREVDAFIALWNPKHRMQRTTVWSP